MWISIFRKCVSCTDPMAVDSSRPFPLIRNKSLNIGAMVRKKNSDGELEFATVQVPSVLSRVVRIPSKARPARSFC